MNRRRGAALATSTAALAVVTALVAPTAAHADPNAVATAQKQLATLQQQASTIDANYSAAQQKLQTADAALATANKQLAASQAQVNQLKKSLGRIALVQFQTAGVGTTTQLITSPDDTSFLNSLGMVQSVTNRANGQLQQLQSSEASVAAAQAQAQSSRNDIAALKKQQGTLVTQYNQKVAAQQQVVSRLSAEEKKRLADLQAAQAKAALDAAVAAAASPTTTSRGTDRTGGSASVTTTGGTSASGRAATAIAFAMAQIGKPYVFGATGPGAYDCSGLMMRAWASAGVSLPRTSQEQFGVGTPVSIGDLQPGDLVFYYSGVSHVAMYIGNGMIVHAANPHSGIKTAPVGEMPIVGARRVG